MRRTFPLFSWKQKRYNNQHPRNIIGADKFYHHKLGASFMKWQFTIPYVRKADSLLHYPKISDMTGKPIDWYHSEPADRYEGARIYGEHTLELKGMPMGKTPEYMQERLRRFFSKFGPVKHCRAEPHPLDPYQCEGTAYISFRDKDAAMKALRAPLKFPASLHDKVVHMRHMDTDKCNDPDYRERAQFWDAELISLARQLHAQLAADADMQLEGKPLSEVSLGLQERELIEVSSPRDMPGAPPPDGRAGIPARKGLLGRCLTRRVPAGEAVRQRFGSWVNFLREPPFDELFSLEARRPPAEGDSSVVASSSDGDARAVAVVRPRTVSTVQRARLLAKAKIMLAARLHAEFSVWWRKGKVPLPQYVQSRILWWDHKPHLPLDLQIMSRPKERNRIFDERFLYKMRLLRSRNEKRKERRTEWNKERKQMEAERAKHLEERREAASVAVQDAGCLRLIGPGLVSKSYEQQRTAMGLPPRRSD